MIDGEHGTAVTEGILVLRAAGAVNGDVISTALFSALFAQALRSGMSPRTVLLDLCAAVPDDDDWESVARERIEQALKLMEARGL